MLSIISATSNGMEPRCTCTASANPRPSIANADWGSTQVTANMVVSYQAMVMM